jgi:hypothetical protein
MPFWCLSHAQKGCFRCSVTEISECTWFQLVWTAVIGYTEKFVHASRPRSLTSALLVEYGSVQISISYQRNTRPLWACDIDGSWQSIPNHSNLHDSETDVDLNIFQKTILCCHGVRMPQYVKGPCTAFGHVRYSRTFGSDTSGWKPSHGRLPR